MQTQDHTRLELVEQAIAKAANVSIVDLRSKKRDRPFAEARMAVWLIARDHLGYSYPQIARVYLRDHTTVIHGVEKMRKGKASARIIEGIKKTCPEVLSRPEKGEARTVENWRF